MIDGRDADVFDGMCRFLSSDEASWVTGQIFEVDGGRVLR